MSEEGRRPLLHIWICENKSVFVATHSAARGSHCHSRAKPTGGEIWCEVAPSR